MLLVNKEFANTLVIRKTNEELVVKRAFLRSKASPRISKIRSPTFHQNTIDILHFQKKTVILQRF